MNKTLANAFAVSLVLHVGALPIAAHGRLLDVLQPLSELKRYQERQSAMSFTFVDSPSTQLRDEEPARKSDLISDKSTVARDTHKASSQGLTETPHVDRVGGGKQVGNLAGTPATPQPPLKIPEQQPVQKKEALQSSRPVMKAQKVVETGTQEDLRVRQEYMEKIKALQEKIDRATKQIHENEGILKKQQEAKTQEEEQRAQEPSSSKGAVGFGGASLHGAASDVQGDVERFGEISFNANRYELGEYFKKLKTKVEEYWLPYLAFTYAGGNLFGNKTVIFFKIMPNGKVSSIRVLEHSGDQLLKEFCLSSVQNTAPFDPLPETFLKNSPSRYLPIVFTFNY